MKEFSAYRQSSAMQGHQESGHAASIQELMQKGGAPAILLPCGKHVSIINSDCLAHILLRTPHPKVGHRVFWHVSVEVDEKADRAVVKAAIDPIMREATGLTIRQLGAHLKKAMRGLGPFLPDIHIDVHLYEGAQQVLGCLTITGQPDGHNCGGNQ
jgi:hypothetical protein